MATTSTSFCTIFALLFVAKIIKSSELDTQDVWFNNDELKNFERLTSGNADSKNDELCNLITFYPSCKTDDDCEIDQECIQVGQGLQCCDRIILEDPYYGF